MVRSSIVFERIRHQQDTYGVGLNHFSDKGVENVFSLFLLAQQRARPVPVEPEYIHIYRDMVLEAAAPMKLQSVTGAPPFQEKVLHVRLQSVTEPQH